ncbi:MAG TPA: hypothetical protein VGG22_01845 [Candidatus Baltobacteraceae bacterium]|jgi:Cu/Zn superoxide dismutase
MQIALATPQEHYVAPLFNAGGQQVGSVNFVPQDAGGIEMVLTMTGMTPGVYAMRISNATACPANGDMVAALPELFVDSRGNGAITAYLPSVSMTGANPIMAHAIAIGAPSVACGVIGSP